MIIVLVGAAYLAPSNRYTDKITNPLIKGLNQIHSFFSDKEKFPEITEETKVYKWQDKDGNWQFSNTEPPKDIDSTVKVYKSDENVVPATKPDEQSDK